MRPKRIIIRKVDHREACWRWSRKQMASLARAILKAEKNPPKPTQKMLDMMVDARKWFAD